MRTKNQQRGTNRVPIHFRLFLSLVALLVCSFWASAQNVTITVKGTVVGDDGAGLPGVNIIEKGSTNGTTTDVDGNYQFSISEDAVLIFSYVGHATQEINVQGRSTIDVQLTVDTEVLEDVVVTGYVSQDRSKVTASIASADVATLSKRNTADVTQALRGTVNGVQVSAVDASPGSPVRINIRGLSSSQGNNNPLVIVDGVQVTGLQYVNAQNEFGITGFGESDGGATTTGLENINANDIKSIEILKDAAAAAIYGNRAANGVIIITTKRGTAGAINVSYNLSTGVQTPYKGPDVANSSEYIRILQNMYGDDLSGGEDLGVPQAALDYLDDPSQFQDYNWYDIVFDKAFIQDHNLAVSGGGDFGNFRVSLGYKDQEGVTFGTGFERLNVRAASDFYVNDKITITSNIGVSRAETDVEAFPFSRSGFEVSLPMYPYFSPYGTNGPDGFSPVYANDRSQGPRNTSFYWGGGDNPEALVRNLLDFNEFQNQEVSQENLQGNIKAAYEILEGLEFSVNAAYNRTYFFNRIRNGNQSQTFEYFDQERSIFEYHTWESNWSLDNILSYGKTLNKHSFNVLGGYVVQKFDNTFISASKSDFLSDITQTLDGPGANPLFTSVSGSQSERRLHSWISQGSYSYDDKYMLTINYRRDGSSSFNKDVRWGDFYGVSLGWNMANESFWSNLGLSSAVRSFKIRGGYGELGRISTGDFAPQATLSYTPYSFGGTLVPGLITPGPLNTQLSWETSRSTNFGFDFGLEKFKLEGSLDWFQRDTDNLLSSIIIPSSAGGGEIQTNDGLIENNGLEAAVNYSLNIGEIDVQLGLNATYIETKFTRIPEPYIQGGEIDYDVPHVIEIYRGRGPAEFWLLRTDGIFKTQEEIDNYISPVTGEPIQPWAQPGDVKYIDANGDGVISTDGRGGGDRVYMGSGVPKWNGGLNLQARYTNFDLTISFYGAFGHKVMNGQKYLLEQTQGFDNFSPALLNAFDSETNPNSSFPRNDPFDIEKPVPNGTPASDRWLENGSFVKAELIQIGYNIPDNLTSIAGISSARVSLSAQNLFTITGYSGIDPEQTRDGFLSAGIDRSRAPQFRSFLLGLSVNF